jgi:hypothetical protein
VRLQLVDLLTDEWGATDQDEGGKGVWFVRNLATPWIAEPMSGSGIVNFAGMWFTRQGNRARPGSNGHGARCGRCRATSLGCTARVRLGLNPFGGLSRG